MANGNKTHIGRRISAVVNVLRGGIVTGAQISERTGVSVRTVYRHIAAARREGWRIDGEAGVGYLLRGERP